MDYAEEGGGMFLRNATFSNILSLPSSLNARDQVLHPYKIKCEIIALCVLVLEYLDKEDERFWNE